MGLSLLVVEGVEADDVIGTLAREATEAGRDVVISTGDKDMAQLVNQHVSLVNTMTGSALDEAGGEEEYGFGPARREDVLALRGDKAGNLTGGGGMGGRTADD